jgi:hypothetical protein
LSLTFPVYGHDAETASWAFNEWGCRPFHVDMAVGVASADDGKLVGAFAFSSYNGVEAEVHFFGPGTLKRHILREIFAVSIHVLNLHRLVVRTRKPSMARGVKKLGAIYEGAQRCVYGPSQGDEHKAECYAFFRKRMEKLAGIKG